MAETLIKGVDPKGLVLETLAELELFRVLVIGTRCLKVQGPSQKVTAGNV